MVGTDEFIDNIKKNIPELPEARKARFINDLGLSEYDTNIIISDKALADYYETALNTANKDAKEPAAAAKTVANWIITELLGKLNNSKLTIKESPISPENIGKLVILISKGTISGKIAKTIFEDMFKDNKDPEVIVKEKGLVQISDAGEIVKVCQEAIDENAKIVADYKSGKKSAIGALVGAVMKKSKGKANPQMVNKTLTELLNK